VAVLHFNLSVPRPKLNLVRLFPSTPPQSTFDYGLADRASRCMKHSDQRHRAAVCKLVGQSGAHRGGELGVLCVVDRLKGGSLYCVLTTGASFMFREQYKAETKVRAVFSGHCEDPKNRTCT